MECRTRKTPKSLDDSTPKTGVNHLMDVLMKNYDIVTVLADFERPDTPTEHSTVFNRQSHGSNSHDMPTLRRAADIDSAEIPRLLTKNGTEDGELLTGEPSESWWTQLCSAVRALCTEVGQALSENCDEFRMSVEDQTRFSAQALKRDIKRCLTASHGYVETGAALRDLQMWKSPLVTLSLFFVYFYSVYRGWLLSMFFFVILLQLAINYLWTQKNINLGLNFLPRKELPIPKLDISGAQLVFDIARRAQKLFKLIADVLEKLNSLFMWRRPDTTFKFFCVMLVFFAASALLSGSACATIVLTAIGGKVFITTYLFNRFPKLRKKFDIIVHFFDRLPVLNERQKLWSSLTHASNSPAHSPNSLAITHGQVKKSRSTLSMANMRAAALRPQFYENNHASSESNLAVLDNSLPQFTIQQHSTEHSSLDDSDSFQSDCEDVETQRECYMYDNDKFFPINLISGRLLVNDICVIFKSNKPEKSDLYIQYQDVAAIKIPDSSKGFKFLSKSGKSLEIHLKNRRKPYVFKGITKRDLLYQTLLDALNAL